MIDKELEKANTSHPADTNGDGKVSKEEHDMYLEFKRKELEDKDNDFTMDDLEEIKLKMDELEQEINI